MNNLEQLTGTVDRFLFQSDENGFSVFVLQMRGDTTVTIKGYAPTIQAGQEVTVSGVWIMHPKFGKQFEAKQCTAQAPTTLVGLKKYLGSGMIKGIGPAYAEKLVNYFGNAVLQIIDENPERLKEVEGIGDKRYETIIHAWKDQKEIATVMVFLQDKGVSSAWATKIYKKYGHESIALITENPYRLADDIWGIGFKTADSIAQNLGFEKNSVKRIQAGIVYAIAAFVGLGHLYAELEALKQKTIELLELDHKDRDALITRALHLLYEKGDIKLISYEDKHYVTSSKFYFCEQGVKNKLLKLLERPSIHDFNMQAIYQDLRHPQEGDIELNQEQQLGIMECLQHKVTVITGGPGTGKTTLIKKLLSVLERNNCSYKLAAPTGRAAKRMLEGTGRHAMTIHRLLEFDFATLGFVHNEQNTLVTDFLIIDEASMIDIFLANSLLKAVAFNTHVVFIGDVHQLPSVGAGDFLNDIIASGVVSCVRLQTIFRQAQDSLIIVNAHRINNGEFPVSFLPNAKRDYIFIKEDLPENIPNHLENIYRNGLAKFGIAHDNAMVLAPMNRGAAGTQRLNYDLQRLLNPGETHKQLTHFGVLYKCGDRVMQIRNNYDKKVFNGDIGLIEDINTEDKVMKVRFYDKLLEYEVTELDELVLAYAITIHKSQGSEYQAVIIPLFMQHFTLLQRNLVYTAITRAKKLCIFIGQPRALAMAIKNNKDCARQTFLQQYLTSDLQCR